MKIVNIRIRGSEMINTDYEEKFGKEGLLLTMCRLFNESDILPADISKHTFHSQY